VEDLEDATDNDVYDGAIKKYSSAGVEDTTNWNKSYTNGVNIDVFYSVVVDSNDNIYAGGGSTDITGDGNGVDVWLKKFTSGGVEDTTNWNITYTNGVNNEAVFALAIDSNDNIYTIAGATDISGDGTGTDWWIKKYYSNGTEYTGAGSNWNITVSNGANAELPYAIAIDSANNVYVAGYSNDLADTGDNDDADWLIKKYYSNGTEDTANWNLTYTSGTNDDYARGIAIDSANNVYVVGYGGNLINATSSEDWWIKKFYSNGTEYAGAGSNWNITFGSGGVNDEDAYSVVIDSQDRIYVIGYSNDITGEGNGDDWLIKSYYSNGTEDTVNWNKTYTNGVNTDVAIFGAINSVDALHVVGYATDITGNGNGLDMWLKKFVIDETSPSPSIIIGDKTILTTQKTSITCTGSDTYNIQTIKIEVGSKELASCNANSCTGTYNPTSAGTKSVKCTVTDQYSNSASTTASIRVSSAGAPSSGSSGGATTTVTDVVAGESVSITSSVGEVTSINIVLAESAENVEISTESHDSKPTAVDAVPDAKIYKYLSVNAENLDQNIIDTANIDFRVSLGWANKNNLGSDEISLYRYVDYWHELKTILVLTDEEYLYYTADTPGFSYFAIGEKSMVVGEESSYWTIYFVIALAIVLVAGYYFYKRY